MAFHKNQLDCQAEDMPLSDVVLYHLINIGARDMDAPDKPWDVSTRTMRYVACLGDRLWSMVTREQNRVCVFCFFAYLETEHASTMIVWRLGSESWRRARVPR